MIPPAAPLILSVFLIPEAGRLSADARLVGVLRTTSMAAATLTG